MLIKNKINFCNLKKGMWYSSGMQKSDYRIVSSWENKTN